VARQPGLQPGLQLAGQVVPQVVVLLDAPYESLVRHWGPRMLVELRKFQLLVQLLEEEAEERQIRLLSTLLLGRWRV